MRQQSQCGAVGGSAATHLPSAGLRAAWRADPVVSKGWRLPWDGGLMACVQVECLFLQSIVLSDSAVRCSGDLDNEHLLEATERLGDLVAEALNLDCVPPFRSRTGSSCSRSARSPSAGPSRPAVTRGVSRYHRLPRRHGDGLPPRVATCVQHCRPQWQLATARWRRACGPVNEPAGVSVLLHCVATYCFLHSRPEAARRFGNHFRKCVADAVAQAPLGLTVGYKSVC